MRRRLLWLRVKGVVGLETTGRLSDRPPGRIAMLRFVARPQREYDSSLSRGQSAVENCL